eukprot:scaffold744_cov370-Prasinococcus_capsulatus_cf.AAC.3
MLPRTWACIRSQWAQLSLALLASGFSHALDYACKAQSQLDGGSCAQHDEVDTTETIRQTRDMLVVR